MKAPIRYLFGMTISLLGLATIALLLFIYGAVLFSDRWAVFTRLEDTFRFLFSIPSGVIMLYIIFIGVFVPAVLVVIVGLYVALRRLVIRKRMLALLVGVWALSLVIGFLLTFQHTQLVIDRIAPFSQDPIEFNVQDEIPDTVQYVFRTTLKNEVLAQYGEQQQGLEPYMFLEVFPGLTESDFDGVEASVGTYHMINGRLEYQVDTTRLVHPAARAITDRGFDTLLTNVSLRLGVDLRGEGTITPIINALVRTPAQSEPLVPQPPQEEDMVMCPMDVKICEDGTAVGRTAPSCAFAECPSSM